MRLHHLLAAGLLFSSIGFAKDKIKPEGDEILGFLEVKEPELTDKTIKPYPFTLSYKGKTLNPNTKLRLIEGTMCLTLSSDYITQEYCGIKIEKKKTTIFTLSALFVKWDPSKTLEAIHTDVGAPAAIVENLNTRLGNPDGKQPFFVLPFTFSSGFNVDSLPAIRTTVEEGKIYQVDVTPKDIRVRIVIEHAPTELPDPMPMEAYKNNELRHFLVIADPNFRWPAHEPNPNDVKNSVRKHGMLKQRVFAYQAFSPKTAAQTFYAFPQSSSSGRSLGLVVNNLSHYFTAAAGETIRLKTKRIDVDKVLITRESGEKYYIDGTYKVMRKNPSGQMEQMSYVYSDNNAYPLIFPTETGVSVLPGIYQVVVNFRTKEGEDSRTYDLDLTK